MIGSLIISLLLSIYVGVIASKRGYSGLLWFFVAVIASPIAAVVAMCCLTDRRADDRRQRTLETLDEMLARAARAFPDRKMPVDAVSPGVTLADEATQRTDVVPSSQFTT